MIKVAWLTPYNVNHLLPEIQLTRKITLHNASWIQNLSESLAKASEIELHIVTHSQAVTETQHIEKNNIHFHVVKYNLPFTNKGFPWYLPLDRITRYSGFRREGAEVLKLIKPDVIHVHGTEGGYFAPVPGTELPCVVSIQGVIELYNKINPSVPGFLQVPIERNTIKQARYFGCRTEWDSSYVRNKNENAVIFDLPEAMNIAFFECQWVEQIHPTLVFVGSVIKRKGIEDLICALPKVKIKFPDIKLKVIGSGSEAYLLHVKSLAAKQGVADNIIWLGSKSSSEIAEELSRSTVFVLPTLIDNSPNSLAEAMAVGVPCIATKVGGIPSMIANETDGLLVEENNPISLAETIEKVLKDRQLQIKLSSNAREKARLRNYPPNVAKRYIEVYEALASEHRKVQLNDVASPR